MTFKEWVMQEHGQSWQGIQMNLIYEGLNESEINEQYDELLETFEEYMELHELDIVPE